MVIVNDHIWADSRSIAQWKYALQVGADSAHIDPNGAGRHNIRPLGLQPVVDFQRIDNSPIIADLCSNKRKFELSEAVISAICSEPKSYICAKGCTKTRLSIGRAYSSCDINTDTIACGSPDAEVGLNVDDFRFVTRAGESLGVGSRKVELSYALAHELGHWFGLGHDDQFQRPGPANLMADSYAAAGAWCLPVGLLTRLDNAVDLNWDYRIVQNSGLKWKGTNR